MRILIAGAGTIGTNLAAALATEGQEVVVIDSSEAALARLEASVDCQTIHGNALSAQTLEDLGIRHTDLLVTVTQDDATNMAVCRLADFYNVPRKLARVRNPEFSDPNCPVPSEHFGIDHIISPEGIAVEHIRRLVRCPGVLEAVDFEGGRIALRALLVSEDSTIAGERVIDVRQHLPGSFLVAAIRRGSRVIIPGGSEQVRIGDTVYLVSAPDAVDGLVKAFNPMAHEARQVLIFGAGVTGMQLARRLAGELDRVLLIEKDHARAHRAADELDELGVEVLHGSALDVDLLGRCNLDRIDFFIALSDDDEENFMSALLFRKFGHGTPIVLTNELHYIDIMESVGLDIVINPRILASSALLRHIRGSTVLSVARLHGEEAEMLEFKASAKSAVTKLPLKDQRLPAGML
nr:Trk system potassium transporter TrkA [Planctomycetota bacterium]